MKSLTLELYDGLFTTITRLNHYNLKSLKGLVRNVNELEMKTHKILKKNVRIKALFNISSR